MFGEDPKPILYLGSDHAGYQMKAKIREYLEGKGFDMTDLGTFSEEPFDYPDIAREVSEKVFEREGGRGILLCGTGIGMAMAANKVQGIRCVNARDEHMAEMARRHNDANVLALGARDLDFELVKKIVDKFLTTDFASGEERHVRRIKKIDMI